MARRTMEPTTQNNTAAAFRFAAAYAKCGGEDASVEVIAPGGLPQQWDGWPEQDRLRYLQQTDAARWRWPYRGIVGDLVSRCVDLSARGLRYLVRNLEHEG